jgi:hypothetical protein
MPSFIETQTFQDLCDLCESGSPEFARRATRLLAKELMARLDATGTNHRTFPNEPGILAEPELPCFIHLQLPTPPHGPRVADFYRIRGTMRRFTWVTLRPNQAPPVDYGRVRAQVEADAAVLLAESEA